MTFSKSLKNRGFTLIEMILSMTIFALVMTSVLMAVQNMSFARIKSVNRITLLEDLYFFSEQLFSKIKDGGTNDYEEYWNRYAYDTSMSNGHYTNSTLDGNYGKGGLAGTTTYGLGLYLCRTNPLSAVMGTNGCLTNNNDGAGTNSPVNFSGSYQRYGEYRLQFTDYNSNANADGGRPGDENGDGNITGDEDDRELGDGPTILSGAAPELYLINTNTNIRTYFRWTYVQDPNAPAGTPACAMIPGSNLTNSGCVGNIQMLKLQGYDLGLTHSGNPTLDPTVYDGKIDTWVCATGWTCSGPTASSYGNMPSGSDAEWVNVFPANINIKSINFVIYPQKDPWLSWAAADCQVGSTSCVSPFIHPYIRLNLTMGYAWSKRYMFRNEDPTISLSTSVSLGDFN